MSKEKRYRLLKDLPDCKAGAIYQQTDDEKIYVCYDNITDGRIRKWSVAYDATYVENNPTWFEEIKEEQPMSAADIMRWQHKDEKERIAFNAAREMTGETFVGGGNMGTYRAVLPEIKQKYPTFEDYKKLNP